MQRRTVRVPLLVSVGVMFAAGCDTITIDHHAKLEARATELAEAYCAAYQSCDCEPLATDALHPDPEQCVSEEKARLIAAFDQAEDDGLEFDPSCMSQLLSRYQDLGCESFAAVQIELGNPALSENFGCALYHGDETDGICEPVAGTSWSDCAAGQECLENACRPVQKLVAEGEECVVNLSAYSYECASGLACSNESATCVPFAGAGEPCDGNVTRCAPDHYCEPIAEDPHDGICQPLWEGGTPCNPITNSTCLGWCVEVEGSDDPTIGTCIDIPAVCMYPDLQPPILKND